MTRRNESERRTYAAAAAFVLALALITFIAFGHPSLGGDHNIHAIVRNTSQLTTGAPVRIAGVDVGQVTGLDRGPGNTAELTLRIDGEQDLRTDATLKIRPRLFLEGGYYIDLKPGSPSAPDLRSGGTIPLPQTAIPVGLNDVLDALDAPARDSLSSITREFDTALSHGGAAGLRRTAPQLAPLFRDAALVAEASRGEQPHDLARLIRASARLSGALARDPAALGGIATGLERTAGALSAGDDDLGRSVEALDALLQGAPTALADVDAALPELRSFARTATPGLRDAPARLREVSAAVAELAKLVAPAERRRALAALGITFRDLPTLINRLSALFPITEPLSQCLLTHLVPTFNSQIPDGDLSTGRPVWQDFAHGLVGLAGQAQNFDGNGFNMRYLGGTSPAGFAAQSIPGLGQVVAATEPVLGSRPVWLGPGVDPEFHPEAQCAAQPVPDLHSQTLGGGNGP
ncbi:MAG: phospholipid/cholesterol/gamma-HCH transport system substrate-binding protein [Thermoleophilaceae bacterium]|nr:phospholipid/cholesterol/gamma-HCH transport system substrate-binding protein [Thermoleophilaceae bacterium]